MPIYAYRCGACGHAQDVLQKMSDPVLTTCPACGAEAYAKQVTAAGFQLKGSGWYVTDFRSNGQAPAKKDAEPAKADAAAPAAADAAKPAAPAAEAAPKADKPAATPAASGGPSAGS
jgi:putative FmdB family regulatory protein